MWKTSVAACAAFFLLAVGGPVPIARAASAPTGIQVTRATLANGLRIVVLRDRLAPVVTTWLNVETGADDEPYTGLAHAQEHMFYRGSRTLSGAAADQIAGFTGDQDNADTQSEITQFYHFVPSADLDLALQLDRSRFHGLLDSQHDWNEERGAIEQEVTSDNSDANYRLYVKLLHHMLAGTPYADDGLGTLESFNRQINAPQLRQFYARWYHPNNALYVIAGDIDPQAAIAAVNRYLGDLPAAALPARRTGDLAPLHPATFVDTSDQSSTEAMIAFRYPGYDDSSYAASVVLGDVLNSQRSDLYGLVASGKAQAVEADVSQWPKAGMIQLVSHVAVATKPQAAIADLEAVIARYRASGVPPDLVEAAKRHEIVKDRTAAASVLDLANTWSEALSVEHRTPEDDVAAIARVTPAQVDALVRSYFTLSTVNTAYAVPKNGGAVGGGGSAGGEENQKQPTAKIESLPAWAEAALRHLAPPERTIAPVAFTLANGLRVVVQPEHASPFVAVSGTVLHDAGLEEPSGKSGVQSVLDALLPYGTSTYSRVAYQAQIDAISATVTNGFTFGLDVPSEKFDRGMQLLAGDELHPALDPKSFAVVKAERVDALTGDATNPDHLAAVATATSLYPAGDPARNFATPESVGALTLDDVKAAYATAFRPDLTTIAIVGDVTPEGARAIAQRWFGDWRSAGPKPAVFPDPVADNAPSNADIPATGRLQDSVRLDETLPLSLDDPDRAPLEVANTVLSGDFSSILIRDMRVTTGYVYYVGTTLDAGKKRSLFSVRYGCDPRNFSKAEAVLERDLHRLQSAPLDRERLARAQSRLVSLVTLQAASYDGLAQRLAFNTSLGLPPDRDYALAREELDATPLSVRYAMARWIRPHGFVRIVEGPAPH
jgi:zinc protease